MASSFRTTALLIVAGLVLATGEAHAYLDPGTGSYVFQMVVALLLSAAFTVKHFWHSLKARLFRGSSEKPEDDATAS